MGRDRETVDRRRFLVTLAAGALAGCTESREATPTDPSRTDTTPTGTEPPASSTAPPTDTPTETPDPGTPEPRTLDGSWPGFGYDLGNSGYAPEVMPLTGERLAWGSRVLGDNTLPQPVVTPEMVHVTSENYFYGIDRADGVVTWRLDLGLPAYFFTPALGDGVLYIPARSITGVFVGNDTPGTLFAVDAATGTVRWKREAFANSSPKLRDGLLYYASTTADAASLEALDVGADTVEERWSHAFGGGQFATAYGTPAVADGLVFATATVGADDPTGRLVALDAATGERQWHVTAAGETPHAPAAHDGDVFFSDEAGTLYSVDAATGETNWTRTFEAPVANKVSVGNGLVYLLKNSKLHALERSSGARKWSIRVGPIEDTFSVTADRVYVGGTTMDAIDATTGERVWERHIDGYTGAYGVPVVVDGLLYAGVCIKPNERSVYDNFVYCIG